jgi:imidazole glycerol-phosphate synthase subunit HisH
VIEVAVVDVGLGNLRSVERALVRAAADAGVEARVTITRDADAIARADKVVMPGQGAFRDCAGALGDGRGVGDAIRASIARGTPYLGICLGLQVLFESSDEAVGCAGLAVFPGEVTRLSDHDDAAGTRLKIPHVGWNTVDARAEPASILPAAPTWFYFVHSFAVRPRDPALVAATTEYGAPFVSAVARDNVLAVQFHPEKSQGAGLALLARFVRA